MDSFVGQLMLVPYNFAPKGYAFCQGQLLAIAQNTALFSLLGTTYGGDGRTTFALPNLSATVPLGAGQGPGLSSYVQGEMVGETTVALQASQIPQHTHAIMDSASALPPPVGNPTGNSPGQPAVGTNIYAPGAPSVQMNAGALPSAGGSAPHNNVMPTLTLNWIIALQGVYPSRP